MRFMIIGARRAIIPYLLERWLGLKGDTTRLLGPVLSQGGKFAFVLLATDAIESIASLITFAVALSVALLKETQQCVS